MKCFLLTTVFCCALSTARADVLTPSTTLRVNFKIQNSFLPGPPDTLLLELQFPVIQQPVGTFTAKLFDGANLLGTHNSSLLGTTTGLFFVTTISAWKSASSMWTFDNPPVVNFTPILNGAIQGTVELTVATGAVDIGLDSVVLEMLRANSSSSGLTVFPSPRITSVSLGAFENFCFGDGGFSTPCPCGNGGVPSSGCENSNVTGGARLKASGATNPDTVVLQSTRQLAAGLSIFLQGDAKLSNGVTFGDGVRCVGGGLKRLYTKNAQGGSVTAPEIGDPSITAQSAAHGDTIAAGSQRYYQVYYRDPDLTYCPNPPGNSWNVSSAVAVTW